MTYGIHSLADISYIYSGDGVCHCGGAYGPPPARQDRGVDNGADIPAGDRYCALFLLWTEHTT